MHFGSDFSTVNTHLAYNLSFGDLLNLNGINPPNRTALDQIYVKTPGWVIHRYIRRMKRGPEFELRMLLDKYFKITLSSDALSGNNYTFSVYKNSRLISQTTATKVIVAFQKGLLKASKLPEDPKEIAQKLPWDVISSWSTIHNRLEYFTGEQCGTISLSKQEEEEGGDYPYVLRLLDENQSRVLCEARYKTICSHQKIHSQ